MKRKLLNEHKAWKKYKVWQKEHASEIRPGQEITSLGEFQAIYNAAGRNMQRIKNDVRYQIQWKTFQTLRKRYKEASGKSLSLEARKQNTHDIADLIRSELDAKRDELKKQGMTNKDIALEISRYYFGS